jgi:glycosyltransferase involved in cell wall biosynthesis
MTKLPRKIDENLVASDQCPHISIGLPVYNGESFLAQAIKSVLSQSYSDFELIISDNGSTDCTEEICRAYAAKDERIRYSRNSENRGAAWNYNRTFELARGKYFRWFAADDILVDTLLEKSAAILDERPEVVLCFTGVVDMDSKGNELEVKYSKVDADAQEAHRRFRGLGEVRPSHKCEEVFGLVRSAILAKTKLIDNYPDSDRTLLAELGLYGPFYEIAEPLFLHRLHNRSSVTANPSRHDRISWFDPGQASKLVFPNWRQLYEMLLLPLRVPLSTKERLLCYRHMVTWIKRRRKHLRGDITWARKQLLSQH